MLKQLFYRGPSINVLHEEYAKKGRIDARAPVGAARDIRIEAPAGKVGSCGSTSPWDLGSCPATD
jgi:hypothetical protein